MNDKPLRRLDLRLPGTHPFGKCHKAAETLMLGLIDLGLLIDNRLSSIENRLANIENNLKTPLSCNQQLTEASDLKVYITPTYDLAI